MNLKSKTALASIMFTIMCIAPFISQTKLDFYGVVSSDADKNMLSMTEDLYLAQLKDMPVNLSDKRSDFFSQTYISEGNADFLKSENGGNAFYVVINKLPDGKWQCSINLKNLDDGKSYSKIKEYDSYYKILMESKTSYTGRFFRWRTSKRNIDGGIFRADKCGSFYSIHRGNMGRRSVHR